MSRVEYVQLCGTNTGTDKGYQLEDSLVCQLQGGPTELDILVWMSRISLELIGQAGIGVSFDTLSEESPPSEYMLSAKQLMCISWFCLLCLLRRILMKALDLFRFLSKGS